MNSAAILTLEKVSKVFGQQESQIEVLHQINFTAAKGQLNLIIGPSGSGKSTLLTIAGGLQSATHGTVKIAGQNLAQMTAKQRDALRLTQIGFILQSYNLLPYLTVNEQFTLVKKFKKTANLSSTSLASLLNELGIAALKDKYPAELSGGQQQRVAIARALYPDPPLILADEPTAALDSQRVKQVGRLFSQLAKQRQKAVIIVTHDLRLQQFADHLYQISDGQISEVKQLKV
ncbi:ABC transporter ATP-binding protein [Liquorilactobacillus vini]|uniref:Putative hemin import ATP-binding protein HrtA n=1 Tax=Liquorilactobacillus vini DSM 20605 TaxID=1133569 RepID=A0A0R2CBZ7_9LACO|nr:ABC transporter ATP-binding protein [Liquorilactobacillus vini]KRM89325.1 ABC transporter, ATP-binding protein [Liquorilactobacillus vini DSM 20605]